MPSNNNKTSGNRFEQDFANLLAEHGFWAHVMQQNKAGQPADIIARNIFPVIGKLSG